MTGDDTTGTKVGTLDAERMAFLEREMISLGLLEVSPEAKLDWYTTEFLITPSDGPVSVLP